MAVRTIACLPALVGAWRDAAGGVVLSTADFYNLDHKTLERPDLIRGKPRTINQSALGDALTSAQAAGKGDLRLQQQSGRGLPRLEQGDRRLLAPGSLHRRARRLSHRHLRLRRHRAAGDDAARALRRAQVLRPSLRRRQQPGDRAARRGEAEHRGLPPAGEAHGIRRGVLRRLRRGGVPAGAAFRAAAHARHRVGHGEGAGLAAARGAGALRAVRRGRVSRRPPASASSTAKRRRNWGSIRCPPTPRRARTSTPRPSWRGATRSRSYPRRAAIS